MISIIIVIYNTKELIDACLDNLFRDKGDLDFEVIFVDNNSQDGSREYLQNLQTQRNIHVIANSKNLGFARAVNQGILASRGKYILLLNSDAVIVPGQIKDLLVVSRSKRQIGIAAPRLLNDDKSIQPSFGNFPSIMRITCHLLRIDKILPLGTVVYKQPQGKNLLFPDWISGACLLVKKEVFQAIGLFDKHYFFGIEDIDFCYRAKQAGYTRVYLPLIEIAHHHQYTSEKLGKKLFIIESVNQSLKYFYKKIHPKAIIRYYIFSALVELQESIQGLKLKVQKSKYQILKIS